MTAQPLPHSTLPTSTVNWAMIAVVVTLLVQFAGAVAYGSRVQAQVSNLQEITQPLKDGQLVEIRTNVAWIRAELERERERGRVAP